MPPLLACRKTVLTLLVTLLAGCSPEETTETRTGAETAPPPLVPGEEALPVASPRRAVNGLAGFRSRSTLAFAGRAEEEFQLVATYVFPDRARWRMEPLATPEDRAARHLRFRYGDRLWLVPEGGEESIPFLEEERRLALLQFELRRVAMTWPAELEWSRTEEGLERAELAGLGGALVAELDAATGRPRAIESRLVEKGGDYYERLEEIDWREEGGRSWPASWKLWNEGKRIWRETIREVIPGGRYLESFFQPPDRRARAQGASSAEPQRVELPPRTVRATPLPAGTSWEDALAAAERELLARQEELAGSGLRLDENPVFPLSENGLPTAVELRLLSPPEKPPVGWSRLAGGEALTVLREGVAGLELEALPALRARVPEGCRPGNPYARVRRREEGPPRVQVVLPLVSGE